MSAADSKQKYLEQKQERREALLLEKKLLSIKIVEMNKEIARCADRKDLGKAMSLFDGATDKNTHTYAAIMNVCVRCGDLQGVIRLFTELKTCTFYKQLDLVCCTTLMKGYCAEGDVANALRILGDMVAQRPHPVSPNIRTVNTILRGCVLIGNNKSAYDLLAQCSQFKPPVKPDESSMEYVVTLATQALDLDRVFPLVGRLVAQGRETAFAMSGMYICVARACALLQQWKQANKYIQLARAALVAEAEAGGSVSGEADEDVEVRETRGATGGKKAWGGAGGDEARARSLQVYVDHKREEQRREVDGIEVYAAAAKAADAAASVKTDTAAALVESYKRFVLFPHATLPAYDGKEKEEASVQDSAQAGGIGVKAYDCLGLPLLCAKAASSTPAKDTGNGKRKAADMEGDKDSSVAVPAGTDSGLLAQFSQHLASAVNNARKKLNFDAIFGVNCEDGGAARARKLEICTGAGEWIVAQAEADRESDWIALELRFDRAYQTFVRGHFRQLHNLCVLRGDANHVLDSVEPASMQQIFINHPEPPQQRGASLESAGKHLLTKEFFMQCEGLLLRAPGSYIVVLTDNIWYGKFLINMLNAAASEVPLSSFYSAACAESVQEAANDFVLYSQAPQGLEGAAVVEASSYFDRLWKRESITERYYIVLKPWDLTKIRPQYAASAAASLSGKDFKGKSGDRRHGGADGDKGGKVKSKAPAYASGNEMSQSNSKYSVKCSGIIVAPQGKKKTFDED